MSTWTPDITARRLIDTTFVQGIGMGLVFVPMNGLRDSVATVPHRWFGVVIAVVAQCRQRGRHFRHHDGAGLWRADHPFADGRALQCVQPQPDGQRADVLNPALPFGAVQADNFINYNAQVQAYANEFLFMFYATLPALAVIFS